MMCMIVEKLPKMEALSEVSQRFSLGSIATLFNIFQHVDRLIIMTLQTEFFVRQQITNTYHKTDWEAVFSARFMRQLRDATIELLRDVLLCSPYRGVISKTSLEFSQL
jgi:hypothetical protein